MIGRRLGRIFPLAARRLVFDFRLTDQRYLFIATEPNAPRIYLVRRRLKDLEKQAINPPPFHLLLKKHLSGCELRTIEKLPHERIISFEFVGENEAGHPMQPVLVVQLTGKSSNLLLLDGGRFVLASLSDSEIEGQRVGEKYSPPLRPSVPLKDKSEIEIHAIDKGGSISDALDHYYVSRESEARFRSQADAAIKKLRSEIDRRRKLIEKLRSDLASHGDEARWKKFGDLLLANLSTAKRAGDKVLVIDYFETDVPQVEIEADEYLSLTQAAEKYFKRYTKANSAAAEIDARLEIIKREIEVFEARLARAQEAAAERDEAFFEDATPETANRKKEDRRKDEFTGARKFRSSDDFEILVGKRAVDNDQLTFRIAGSLDLWLHAADYPGSHVVVRNPNRKDVPQQTLLEAAQLAAFYSSGKSQPKAAVHYTQKKFVNKPRGAAPGLVRLASFKTILVEPVIPPAVDKKQIKNS